jgi:Mg2+ and Co2+ transporter CorA
VPEVWWYTWCRRANGYFGSEENMDDIGNLKAHSTFFLFTYKAASADHCTDTWFRFIIKRFVPEGFLEDKKDYVWYKFNIFTKWVAQTQTTYVLVFDPRREVKELIKGPEKPDVDMVEIDTKRSLSVRNEEENEPKGKPSPRLVAGARVSKSPKGLKPTRLLDRITAFCHINPYAIHALFMEDIVYQLEESVWGIRDRLRVVELQRTSKEDPNPNYESIHDVARHAIHVSETLDAAITTIVSIKAEHDQFQRAQEPTDKTKLGPADRTRNIVGNRVRRRLDFSESMLRNLRFRSSSNMTRLQNEIQLAFNIVSQQIGRSAKADSNAMLGIALLTMLFLPPTFMSSIFSMSFFDFNSDLDRWVLSAKFWLYWAFTVPITLMSIFLFGAFYVLNKPPQPGILTPAEVKKVKLKNLLLQWRHRDDREQPNPA